MKHIQRLILIVAIAGITVSVNAQKPLKIGHINSNELLEMMPGIDTAEAKLKDIAANIEKQFELMKNEYNTKLEEYMTNEEKMSDLEKEMAADELQDLQNRIDKFRTKAQENLDLEKEKIYSPILEQAQNAIDEVAKENEFNYIFDTGYGIILYFDKGVDIMPLVKKKLGIE